MHRMTLVSFRLFRKNLGNLRELFGQMVHPLPYVFDGVHGCLPFGQKIWKFRFEVEICGIPSEIVPLFPFGTEQRKIPYHLNESSISRPFPARAGRNA